MKETNNQKTTEELLGLLEKIICNNTKEFIKKTGYEITNKEARNIVSKVGLRIMREDGILSK